MGYNSVTVTTSATKIASANPGRTSIIITNTDEDATLYIGPNDSVTASNGTPIAPGGNLTEDDGGSPVYKGDIYGIVSASTIDARYWERTK